MLVILAIICKSIYSNINITLQVSRSDGDTDTHTHMQEDYYNHQPLLSAMLVLRLVMMSIEVRTLLLVCAHLYKHEIFFRVRCMHNTLVFKK